MHVYKRKMQPIDAARQERAVANEDEDAMAAVHETMELWTKMCVADAERHQV
jgi:hypothetical protein